MKRLALAGVLVLLFIGCGKDDKSLPATNNSQEAPKKIDQLVVDHRQRENPPQNVFKGDIIEQETSTDIGDYIYDNTNHILTISLDEESLIGIPGYDGSSTGFVLASAGEPSSPFLASEIVNFQLGDISFDKIGNYFSVASEDFTLSGNFGPAH